MIINLIIKIYQNCSWLCPVVQLIDELTKIIWSTKVLKYLSIQCIRCILRVVSIHIYKWSERCENVIIIFFESAYADQNQGYSSTLSLDQCINFTTASLWPCYLAFFPHNYSPVLGFCPVPCRGGLAACIQLLLRMTADKSPGLLLASPPLCNSTAGEWAFSYEAHCHKSTKDRGTNPRQIAFKLQQHFIWHFIDREQLSLF